MRSLPTKIRNGVVWLILLCVCGFGQEAARVAVGDSRQQIEDAVARFSKAFVEADVSTLDALLSEDYVHTNSTGSVLNKRQWLEYIKTRRADLEAGRLVIESYENTDLRIRVHAESAIVTGSNVAKGKREGKPFVTELRFTHLWIRQSGQWKRAAFHDSPLTK
jgi:ketosteroid isomerase-like protein